MLRKINSGINKNTDIFQQISDTQAAFVSGGSEQNLVSDILSDVADLLNNLSVPIDVNSLPLNGILF